MKRKRKRKKKNLWEQVWNHTPHTYVDSMTIGSQQPHAARGDGINSNKTNAKSAHNNRDKFQRNMKHCVSECRDQCSIRMCWRYIKIWTNGKGAQKRRERILMCVCVCSVIKPVLMPKVFDVCTLYTHTPHVMRKNVESERTERTSRSTARVASREEVINSRVWHISHI